MKQILNIRKSVKVEEVPEPICGDKEVLVANVYSLISAGTERQSVEMRSKSLISLQREMKKGRPDLVEKVKDIMKSQGILSAYKLVTEKLNEPNILGYSSAGIVVEIGESVSSLSVGDRVACGGGGYAVHAGIVRVPENLCVKIPENVELKEAAYTTVGAIALQGVRRASLQVGERAVVIGLGLVGLLTAQILKASGMMVIGFDISKEKVSIARKLGITAHASREVDMFSLAGEFTQGVGADAVIITASTKSNGPVEDALRLIRKKGRVVVVGAVGMNIPRAPFYEKEGDFLISTSYGPGRYDPNYEEKGIDYPIAYVRWTERRNMEAFLNLLSSSAVDVKSLTTHVFEIGEEAIKAYDVIKNGDAIGVLIEYGTETRKGETIVELPEAVEPSKKDLMVGIIGAGNFAKKFHLPNLQKIDGFHIYAVATGTGANAKHIGKKYGARYVSTDYEKICSDKNISAVLISTRHDTHTKIAVEALKNGKHVFVEKPAARNEKEMNELLEAARSSGKILMVGLNRRFSPFVRQAKKELERKAGPILVEYRVNAGKLPPDHWVYDPEQGGRIVGESVHFFDTINYLVGDEVSGIYVDHLSFKNKAIKDEDNFVAVIRYKNGSIGTLTYTSIGNRKYPKEHIYMERDGMSIELDDFRSMQVYGGSNRGMKSKKQDKGHYREMVYFRDAIKTGKFPVSLQEMALAHRMAFLVDKEVRRV